MLDSAEDKLIRSICTFGIVGTVTEQYGTRYRTLIDINAGNNYSYNTPGQCQAFLTSSRNFVWFIEQWNVIPKAEGQTSFDVPLVTLENKKVYPAKIRGLNLALLGSSSLPISVTVRWREGLIRYSNYSYSDATVPCLRPGFGQVILSDLNRPLVSETVVTNHLGLIGATANSSSFWGPLGCLLSAAFNVDETIAAKYNASQSKKKKKSLNSQDYEQIPTYPAYDVYVYTGY